LPLKYANFLLFRGRLKRKNYHVSSVSYLWE